MVQMSMGGRLLQNILVEMYKSGEELFDNVDRVINPKGVGSVHMSSRGVPVIRLSDLVNRARF